MSITHVHDSYDGGQKTYSGNYAGEMKILVTDDVYGLDGFETVGYCVQIEESISNGTYTEASLSELDFTVEMESQIAWLMNEYAPAYYGADSPSSKAGGALQLAIWDVVYPSDEYWVNGGDTDSEVYSLYLQYMAALTAASPMPDLTQNTKFAVLDGTQDLVVYNIQNVPVPSTALLLGSGLLAFVGLMRRRQRIHP